jgi:hypothetical protein
MDEELADSLIAIVSDRARERREQANVCWSNRSKKHMLIRADEAGQIVALLRAALGEKKDD